MPQRSLLTRLLEALPACPSRRNRTSPHHVVEPLEPRQLYSATGLVGDANFDGMVNQNDVRWVMANWNATVADNKVTLNSDLDGDGFIGLRDLNLVLGSPDFDHAPAVAQASASQSASTPAPNNEDVIAGYYTDFNGTITGNWAPTFERNLPTVDPSGQPVGVGQPRWGDLVGISAAQAWQLVLAREDAMTNIGYGPGADGQWLSIWVDRATDEFVAFNHDLSQWKTVSVNREGQSVWLKQADWESDTRYQPRTGQIVPGGLWVTYLQRDADLDPTLARDWTPVGTSFGVVQEVTYDNLFDQARTILDTPRQPGLIDSETGKPYENFRGREWAMSLTPVVVDGRVEKVWYAFTDYMQDNLVPVEKPGGTTWVFLAERDAVGDHYTIRQPRIIEQQEDPLGKDDAFEHRHSAMVVLHETGEVDVLVSSGDTAAHAFLKRYRIDDPDNYETSTLTAQLTGLLGNTGEASPQLISFQVGGAPNKVLAATDGRDEAVIELTIPVDINAPAQVRSVIGNGFVKTPALTVNLECARPWERSGYAVSVRPFLTVTPDLIPPEASVIFYSEDGVNWVELANNIANGEIVFHDNVLVVRDVGQTAGIYKMALGEVDAVRPLLISPGGTQRLAATLTEATDYADTTVTFLQQAGGLWEDQGVPLAVQPPALGPVVKVSRLDSADQLNLTQIYLNGANKDFQAGGYLMRVWVMPVAGQTPYLNITTLASDRLNNPEAAQPTATRGWMPVTDWDYFDPYGDGSGYIPVSRIAAQFNGDAHLTEFYIAYDLLLNQADAPGTVAPGGDFDGDAFVGIQDLNQLLADWNKTSIPVVIPGDFNEDGFIGIADLNIVLSNWNQSVTPGDLSKGDGTGDGFVGIEDLNFVLSLWNQGVLPVGPLETDINHDGVVGIADLNDLLGEWNNFRPTTGLLPSYPIAPSDQTDPVGEPEKLSWDLPAPVNGGFTAALAMSIPIGGIDATWGEGGFDGFSNGSTNYGTLYADADNYLEVWHHREAHTFALEVVVDGRRVGSITIKDAWLNLDGRFHWAISYSPAAGLRFAVLNRGNEVASGTLSITLPFTPTTMQLGSHDWLSVPAVGVKSAYYNPSGAQSTSQLLDRVRQDLIYQ